MRAGFEQRQDGAPPARPRRRRAAETPTWRREQDRMVERIADHAIAGGASRAGPGASDEQAVDAFLEVLRRDLLAFARREG